MGEMVTAIFHAAGWSAIKTYRDYAGLERVVVARKTAH
jgi:methylase of polypeptide subunit release factors